jgi:hypothetical protein
VFFSDDRHTAVGKSTDSEIAAEAFFRLGFYLSILSSRSVWKGKKQLIGSFSLSGIRMFPSGLSQLQEIRETHPRLENFSLKRWIGDGTIIFRLSFLFRQPLQIRSILQKL